MVQAQTGSDLRPRPRLKRGRSRAVARRAFDCAAASARAVAWAAIMNSASKPSARLFALWAAVMIGCAPSSSQIAQTRTEQSWAIHFRKVRQDCLDNVQHACASFENALAAQRAYDLYYNSVTIPGLSTPAFTSVTVPAAIGVPRFSGGVGGFR